MSLDKYVALRWSDVSNLMDSEAGSIFDDLASPGLPLLDARDTEAAQAASDIDLMQLTDAVPDWDRALLHPLPPPPNVHSAVRIAPPQQINFPVGWLDGSAQNEGLVPVAAVYNRDDDEDSVDDTSPPVVEEPMNRRVQQRQGRTPDPSDVGLALQRVTGGGGKRGKAENLEARGNVSHTRRCRAKVNNNFERLLHALPPPPEGVEVKHKAQILAYAIDRFRVVRCHNMKLEMQLALSSPYQMHRWVNSVVSSSSTLTEALKPFMALICLTKKWKYAELWAPHSKVGSGNTALRYITGALPPTVEGEELHRLRQYRSNSRKYVFRPRTGVPGRVFLTMRPEWLPLLNDPVAFPRAPHAVKHKVEVTFAVPVIVNGSVQMVVEFFDTNRRDYDPETMNMANEIAVMFGKAFTGQNSYAQATQL